MNNNTKIKRIIITICVVICVGMYVANKKAVSDMSRMLEEAQSTPTSTPVVTPVVTPVPTSSPSSVLIKPALGDSPVVEETPEPTPKVYRNKLDDNEVVDKAYAYIEMYYNTFENILKAECYDSNYFDTELYDSRIEWEVDKDSIYTKEINNIEYKVVEWTLTAKEIVDGYYVDIEDGYYNPESRTIHLEAYIPPNGDVEQIKYKLV